MDAPRQYEPATNLGVDLSRAAEELKNGGCVAIPTETVYGLAAIVFNPVAVSRIFKIKNRPFFDPLIVHISHISQVNLLVSSFPKKAQQLAKEFWPGPLTLVLPRNAAVPDLVTAGLNTVGIRLPDHALARKLIALVGKPLAAPSANPFGYISPTTARHVADQLGDKPDYILDGGTCRVGLESTIVSFEKDEPEILRLGGLEISDIENCIGKVSVVLQSSSKPAAPGMLTSHYAPRKKLYFGDLGKLIAAHPGVDFDVLAFRDKRHQKGLELSPAGDVGEAARNLFSFLRKLDANPSTIILAEELPETGLGRAINDRLRRAATR